MSYKEPNAYIVMKTFCGIFLCCLDALHIIKKNGIAFNDFWRTVKYTHFSIFLFHKCRA